MCLFAPILTRLACATLPTIAEASNAGDGRTLGARWMAGAGVMTASSGAAAGSATSLKYNSNVEKNITIRTWTLALFCTVSCYLPFLAFFDRRTCTLDVLLVLFDIIRHYLISNEH